MGASLKEIETAAAQRSGDCLLSRGFVRREEGYERLVSWFGQDMDSRSVT